MRSLVNRARVLVAVLAVALFAVLAGSVAQPDSTPVADACCNYITASLSISGGDITLSCTGYSTYSDAYLAYAIADTTQGVFLVNTTQPEGAGAVNFTSNKYATVSGHNYDGSCWLLSYGSGFLDTDNDYITAP